MEKDFIQTVIWYLQWRRLPQSLGAWDNSISLNFYIPSSLYFFKVLSSYFFTLLQILIEYFHLFFYLNQHFLTIEVVGQEHIWNEHTPVNIVGLLSQAHKHVAKLEVLCDFWRDDFFIYNE